MKSLETLVQRLEKEETPLDESLRAFEEGVALLRQAQQSIAAAQQRVSVLLDREDDLAVSGFTSSEGEG